MRVDVTAEDIANGGRLSLASCPIALALNRATGHEWFVAGLWAGYDVGRVCCLPRRARLWAARFDAGQEVSPISFALNLPTGVQDDEKQ